MAHDEFCEQIPLQLEMLPLDEPISCFVDDAAGRVRRFLDDHQGACRIAEFVASDLFVAFSVLREVRDRYFTAGASFCEWGSGLGGVSCLAAMLGFEACGIEIQQPLVAEARRLAADYRLPVKFFSGSYKPPGCYTDEIDEQTLDQTLGFSPVDFDLIYVFAWPGERQVVDLLFRRFARPGSMLITYLGGLQVRLDRKRSRGSQPAGPTWK
jgi:hypothetical protein